VSNVPLIDWVVDFLSQHGWQADIHSYNDEQGTAKANLIARPRSAEKDVPIGLAFVCHTDTVPYASAWTGALRLNEHTKTGTLHGCGSCDVKGALACFLAAIDRLNPARVQPDCALILTADEEIGCRGMERLLESDSLKIGSAIVSEPTELHPGVAGKGYGLARVTVRGAEAHSAFPEKGVPAIQHAAHFIQALEERMKRTEISDALFTPPRTTFNVGVIEGGTAKNIVPGICSFLVEWRPIPSEHPHNAVGVLEAIAGELEAREPRLKIQVEALRGDAGFAPAGEGALQQRLRALLPADRTPVGISFGSEASRLARVAGEVIVIGPGDMQTAHSERECVPIAELEAWTSTLCALFARS
jgi:acetylornithine deacetylase